MKIRSKEGREDKEEGKIVRIGRREKERRIVRRGRGREKVGGKGREVGGSKG